MKITLRNLLSITNVNVNLRILFWISSKLEEASIQKRAQCEGKLPPQQELRLHELRAEKYNGLIRLLKPGCRTIILLADAQSRLKLMPIYHKAVWPYRYALSNLIAFLVVSISLIFIFCFQ
jgi:DnaJ family protein C protein 16